MGDSGFDKGQDSMIDGGLVAYVGSYKCRADDIDQVRALYRGAGVTADSVTTPLEEKINGAAGMIYMSSFSTDNGDSIINMTFKVGADQDIAQMEALTRSNEALAERDAKLAASDAKLAASDAKLAAIHTEQTALQSEHTRLWKASVPSTERSVSLEFAFP